MTGLPNFARVVVVLYSGLKAVTAPRAFGFRPPSPTPRPGPSVGPCHRIAQAAAAASHEHAARRIRHGAYETPSPITPPSGHMVV
ncbi:hypothetical protein BM1_07077 [Bipolaris maydis]|nr:hypothetical protein BM1_07077 [Bipolaris maydis]